MERLPPGVPTCAVCYFIGQRIFVMVHTESEPSIWAWVIFKYILLCRLFSKIGMVITTFISTFLSCFDNLIVPKPFTNFLTRT